VRLTVRFVFLLTIASPAFAQDDAVLTLAKKVGEIGTSLKGPERIASEPEKHFDNFKALSGLKEELAAIRKKYADDLKSARGQGPFNKLDIALRYADGELKEYERYAAMFASKTAIDEQLERVRQSAKIGIDNNSPAFFKPDGDIDRGLAKARLQLKSLEALDPKSKDIEACKIEIEKATKDFDGMQGKMEGEILATNAPPPGEYRKTDREALLKLISEKWSKEGTKDTVLKVGIVTGEWTRGVSWQKVGTEFQKSDRSRLQGYVLVAKDDTLAVRCSINLTKDHLAADAIAVSMLSDPKAEPPLGNRILRAKLK